MSAPTIDPATPFNQAPTAAATARDGRSAWVQRLRPRANPILRRELRVRMRGRRAFIVLGAYLLLIGAIVFGIQRVLVMDESGSRLQSFQVGQILFATFTLVEMSLLALIAPALTATAICGEREGGTFDLLRATPVRAHTIVWGKLVAALGYAALLIVASIPIASAVFLFGGVSPEDVWTAFLLLGVTTVAFGLLGLCCSALVRKTGLASVLAYVVTVGVIVGSVGTYIFLDAVDGGLVDNQFSMMGEPVMMNGAAGGAVVSSEDTGTSDDSTADRGRMLLAVNPMMAMASLLAESVDQSPDDQWGGRGNSATVIGDWLEFFRVGDAAFDGSFRVDQNGRPIPVELLDEDPLWHTTLRIYGIASLVLIVVTTLLVARLEGRPRRRLLPTLRLPLSRRSPSTRQG